MKTIADEFEPYKGTHEYNGIVAIIHECFYGSMVRASWCATSESYFAHKMGILDQFGGKNENVYYMMESCRAASKKTGKGKFYYKKDIPAGMIVPRGTPIFLMNDSGTMTPSSSKHVTNAAKDFVYTAAGTFTGIGGNQSDEIRDSEYSQSRIYAIFLPDYGQQKKPTIKLGYKDKIQGGTYCAELQEDLNILDDAGLDIDGSCGSLTDAAIRAFQTKNVDVNGNPLEVDGSCGPKTWAKIDALLDARKMAVPSIIGGEYKYTYIVDGYAYIPDLDIWVSKK